MNVADRLSACLTDPSWLPFQLDLTGNRVLLVRVDDEQSRQAAFLDQRILTPEADGFWVSLKDFQHVQPAANVTDGLFHVGHCGSTLVSRMLGAVPGVRALREPLAMRELALFQAQQDPAVRQWLPRMLLWLARRAPDETHTHIKFTSACACLLPAYLQQTGKAVALFTSLENYLASASRGGGTGADITGFANQRQLEWNDLCPAATGPSAPEELAACGWLLNMNYFVTSADRFPQQVMLLNFEDWLADVNGAMITLAKFHSIHLPDVDWSRHPLLSRYAKQIDVPYDAESRLSDLRLASQRHGAFIQGGLKWARRQASVVPGYDAIERWLVSSGPLDN